MRDLTPFQRSALGALLWSETDEDGSPLLDDAPGTHYDSGSDVPCQDFDFDPEGLDAFLLECDAFQLEVREAGLGHAESEDQTAVDFVLTRNHHGAGFWDRGLGEVGDRLTRMAHAYGTVGLDRDPDSGLLYFHG